MVTGKPGLADQLEGVRVVIERLLQNERHTPERRGVQYVLAQIGPAGHADVDFLLNSWWQAFPSRTDVELILPAGDADEETSRLAQVDVVRELRGMASTPVRVQRTDRPWRADRRLTVVRADITPEALLDLVPPARVAAPPWAPMLRSPWVQYDLR